MAEIKDSECALITLIRRFFEDRMTPEIEDEINQGDLNGLAIRLRNWVNSLTDDFIYVDKRQIAHAIDSRNNELICRCFLIEHMKLRINRPTDPEEQKRFEIIGRVIREIYCV